MATERFIVLACDAAGTTFALESRQGDCVVFMQSAGPVVQAGDVLAGHLRGETCFLARDGGGVCEGVVQRIYASRDEALACVRAGEPPLTSRPWAQADAGAGNG